jgi:hypothetical protein
MAAIAVKRIHRARMAVAGIAIDGYARCIAVLGIRSVIMGWGYRMLVDARHN